ncbi:MAG: hypothetical protein M1818_001709 [Claussenomyces sp. TS43310]|nr:MAG: hypothetical protein M1818_001709 [Claussenomyces sp. TS43310]
MADEPVVRQAESASDNSPEVKKDEEPKESKAKVLWGKLGLDAGTLIMMFKGSIPPIIGIAFFQSDAVAETYGNLGYLVAIISVLSICIMPRAKYLQTLVLNVIGICIGSAVSLLGLWSGTKARLHTTPAGSTAAYNSSQSAVCAIWLFANIWFVNVLRAKIPALQFPVIMYSIFTNVSFTYGPLFPTMAIVETFMRQLLTGFLTAFAIATGVSLFIVPVSSRTVVFKEITGYLAAVRSTLKAQTVYLQSLEKSNMFRATTSTEGIPKAEEATSQTKKPGDADDHVVPSSPESKALKAAIAALTGLHGKLHGDLAFGKREFAWGKLGPDDLDAISNHFRSILLPLIGMSTINDMFERIAERRGWIESKTHFDDVEAWEQDAGIESELEEKRLWNEIMKQLHEPFAVATEAMDEGLEHVGILLEFIPRPKQKSSAKDTAAAEDVDVEAEGDSIKPGEMGFADFIRKRMEAFYSKRAETLRTWAKEKGLSATVFDAAHSSGPHEVGSPDETHHYRDQQQLYMILYMEHLLYCTGLAIHNLAQFAESKVKDGTMKKNRMILPGQRRIRKWITSLGSEDSTVSEGIPDSLENGQSTVYMGSSFNGRRDPEHLPATTAWQKFGNGMRTIPHFMGSVESAFGFRVACATMTIGIVAYLRETQEFFIQQRLVWAMIIIAIGMTITAGQSMFGFFTRVAGTALAMVFSFIIWYIVDGKIPGVIVMLWFFIFIEMYFFMKFPRLIAVWLICIVTQVLIIGYELQVLKIGVAVATKSGQPYYPVYELAPYRLACVAGGSFVAFIWTVFPYPLSDRSWLRKDLGATIYLLANYYSVVHSTIVSRVQDAEGDMDDPHSPGKQLERARHKVFGKLMLLLPSLRQHAEWEKWELSIGGKFPKETYAAIIDRLEKILQYTMLMSYATQTWSKNEVPEDQVASRRLWLEDLSRLLNTVDPTTHAMTSVLALLSASVTQGSALPPFIQMPQPYQLSRRLEALDKGILDSRHVEEPGYSAWAVMQITSSLVSDDLKRLVDHVRDLVGEVDFSFRVENTSLDSIEKQRNHRRKGKAE